MKRVPMMPTTISIIPGNTVASVVDLVLPTGGTWQAEVPIASGSMDGTGTLQRPILLSAMVGTGQATTLSSTRIRITPDGISPTMCASEPTCTLSILVLNN